MGAVRYAAKIQPGSTVRWDRLERAAFEQHPSVLTESRRPRRDISPLERVGLGLAAVVAGVVFLAPILGLAAVSEGRFTVRRTDYDAMIPVAGVLYAVTFVAVVGLLVTWLVRKGPRSGFAATYSVMTLVLGSFAAYLIATRGPELGVDGWQTWILPVYASVVAAAVLGVLLGLRHLQLAQAAVSSGTARLSPAQRTTLERRRAAAQALSEADREAIAVDLEAAIADVERRGLVTGDEAGRARGIDLGGLGLLMPPSKAGRTARPS